MKVNYAAFKENAKSIVRQSSIGSADYETISTLKSILHFIDKMPENHQGFLSLMNMLSNIMKDLGNKMKFNPRDEKTKILIVKLARITKNINNLI